MTSRLHAHGYFMISQNRRYASHLNLKIRVNNKRFDVVQLTNNKKSKNFPNLASNPNLNWQ